MVASAPERRQRGAASVLGCGAVSQQPARTATAVETEPFTMALERMNRFQEPEAHILIADLGLPRGSQGLDVGCGVGLYTLWLAEAVGSGGGVVGIEPSAERVEAARTLTAGVLSAPRLQFREGDATALPFGDATFDWVWCGDVLHHVAETARALGEFARVLRPGGRIVIKESQLLAGVFLPGHPALERRLRQAEMEWSRHEGGDWSFEERRQRTLASLRAAGLFVEGFRTYLLERRAPLPAPARDYIRHVVFERNWGPRLRDRLTPAEWQQRSALCEAEAPAFVLRDPDYYCLYPISVLIARREREGRAAPCAAPRPS
jgi:demethylmenaquinone methyltransferase/2-methoxy-6-polyprenyl-1,4-benzoquinol methylase